MTNGSWRSRICCEDYIRIPVNGPGVSNSKMVHMKIIIVAEFAVMNILKSLMDVTTNA